MIQNWLAQKERKKVAIVVLDYASPNTFGFFDAVSLSCEGRYLST